jgi:hypothetical protein
VFYDLQTCYFAPADYKVLLEEGKVGFKANLHHLSQDLVTAGTYNAWQTMSGKSQAS